MYEVSLVSCFSSKGRSATWYVASHVDAMPCVCDVSRVGGWCLWDVDQAHGLIETVRINASGSRPFSIEKVKDGEGGREVFVTKPFLSKSLQGETVSHQIAYTCSWCWSTSGDRICCEMYTKDLDVAGWFCVVNQCLRLPGVSHLFFFPFVGQKCGAVSAQVKRYFRAVVVLLK